MKKVILSDFDNHANQYISEAVYEALQDLGHTAVSFSWEIVVEFEEEEG